MRKLLQTKYLTTLCFLCVLALMFALGIAPVYRGFLTTADHYAGTGELDFSLVEAQYTEQFKGKTLFITLNGAWQRMAGARVVNQRYKLDNGHLSYIIEEQNVEGMARNTVEFRDALAEMDVPMVYINTPFQIHRQDKQLPESVEDYSNENADRFLSCLKEADVPVLDLRESMAADGLDHYEMFYKTDHHWTAEAGFWAAGEIADYLSAMDETYAVQESLRDPSCYNFDVYEGIFLGSAGRRVGSIYAGTEDFTVITPAFETEFTFSAENGEILRQGSFYDTFIVPEKLRQGDLLASDVYLTYCGMNFTQMTIHNRGTAPDTRSTPKRVLLIRDSFSDVLIPFLAMEYEYLDVLDLRGFKGDVLAYVRAFAPDMVVVIYNPGAYTDTNLNMFEFLNGHKQNGSTP